MGKGFSEFVSYDAMGLAGLVRKKEVTPKELLNESIRRIESCDGMINAVITRMFDEAEESLKGLPVDAPFYGVPFLLKDLVSPYAGVRFSRGCRAYKDYVPDYDATLVTRYKKAGLVILGKTNTPELGLMGVTEPALFGPTRNPWNLDHSPGGSSGGSGAAVAAGFVPVASGGDGGGSIRLPASCCGLFGLKPSRGRMPNGPDYGEVWFGASVTHVLSRSVRDSAALLDLTAGAEPGDPFTIAPPSRSWLEEVTTDPKPLKVGMLLRSPLGGELHSDCRESTLKTARLLESLGHHVEEVEHVYDGEMMANAYLTMYYANVADELKRIGIRFNRKPGPADVEPGTYALALIGQNLSAAELFHSLGTWNQLTRDLGTFHERFDLLLTPTMAQPPALVGSMLPAKTEVFALNIINRLGAGRLLKMSGVVDAVTRKNLNHMPFTQIANLTGRPAMSVPLGQTRDGLPCGSHFIARFGAEATLFQLAGQLERAQPWFDNRPPGYP